MLNVRQIVRSSWISLLLVGSILIGAVIGHHWSTARSVLGANVDRTLLTLVGLLFFGVRFEAITQFRGGVRTLVLILVSNYLFVPAIGYFIASTLLAAKPLFMAGLMIYFMSPCTDWFLGFTRLARGNVALGTALIPINMVVQLLLYPVYLHLFTRHMVEVAAGVVGGTLLHWFLVPLVVAVPGHYALRGLPGNAFCPAAGWCRPAYTLGNRAAGDGDLRRQHHGYSGTSRRLRPGAALGVPVLRMHVCARRGREPSGPAPLSRACAAYHEHRGT
jgi:arsenite transporter